jgi:Zn-dependent protease with chaperone function
VILAVIVAGATGAAALLVPRRLRPHAAARLITSLVLLSCGAVVWTLLLIISANVAQLHGIAERLSWCHDLVRHHRGSFSPLGIAALIAVVLASISVIRVGLRQRRQPTPSDERELAIVASEYAVAYALPGDPGQIVVSTGMLRSLDPQEQRVLLAHERSHLRRRHHRYIRMTEVGIAAMPLLAPLNARLRFVLERWADEDAAAEVGDRAVVACAIARAALATQSTPAFSLAMAECGVVERVEIMLAGPSERSVVLETLLGAVALAGAMGLVASLLLLGPTLLAALGVCR